MNADRCDFRDVKIWGLICEQLKGEWHFFYESFKRAFLVCVKLTMCGSKQWLFLSPHIVTINSLTYIKIKPCFFCTACMLVSQKKEASTQQTQDAQSLSCRTLSENWSIWVFPGVLFFLMKDNFIIPYAEVMTNRPQIQMYHVKKHTCSIHESVWVHSCAELGIFPPIDYITSLITTVISSVQFSVGKRGVGLTELSICRVRTSYELHVKRFAS